MLAEHHVGNPEPVEQAVVDHRLGALADLFRGLEDEQQGAAPAARVRRQLGRRAEQAGDVRVVTAGVHHRHVLAVGALAAVGRRVVEAGPLEHRERVHVGPEQHGRAVAVGQQADDAGAADARRRLVAEVAQPRGHDPGRPVLGERELGMRVQIAIDLGQVSQVNGTGHSSPPHLVSDVGRRYSGRRSSEWAYRVLDGHRLRRPPEARRRIWASSSLPVGVRGRAGSSRMARGTL